MRHRFSQKTNIRTCFVCFFTLHDKQIKFVRFFGGRIYGAPICFLVLSDLYWSHPDLYIFLRPWKHQHKNPLTKSKIIPWQSRIFQIICHHPFLKIKLTYIYFTNFWSVLIFFKRGGLKSEQWKFYTKNVWYYDM